MDVLKADSILEEEYHEDSCWGLRRRGPKFVDDGIAMFYMLQVIEVSCVMVN